MADSLEELFAAVRSAGYKVDLDAADSVLMADFRNACPPGSKYDLFADSLADDLASHARTPVTRVTCAAMVRAAADLKALAALGWDAHEVLAVLGVAAAKLEMRASHDG